MNKDQDQMILINALWTSRSVDQKRIALNALAYYLDRLNGKNEKALEEYYYWIVFAGKISGVYCNLEMEKSMISPHGELRGYDSLKEALDAARKFIGINFILQPECHLAEKHRIESIEHKKKESIFERKFIELQKEHESIIKYFKLLNE